MIPVKPVPVKASSRAVVQQKLLLTLRDRAANVSEHRMSCWCRSAAQLKEQASKDSSLSLFWDLFWSTSLSSEINLPYRGLAVNRVGTNQGENLILELGVGSWSSLSSRTNTASGIGIELDCSASRQRNPRGDLGFICSDLLSEENRVTLCLFL